MSVADEDEPPLKRATLEAHKRLLEQVSMLHPLSAACVQLADILVAEVVDETVQSLGRAHAAAPDPLPRPSRELLDGWDDKQAKEAAASVPLRQLLEVEVEALARRAGRQINLLEPRRGGVLHHVREPRSVRAKHLAVALRAKLQRAIGSPRNQDALLRQPQQHVRCARRGRPPASERDDGRPLRRSVRRGWGFGVGLGPLPWRGHGIKCSRVLHTVLSVNTVSKALR